MSRILIFDSGVGGLSVLSELQSQFKSAEYIYLADTGFYPYGTKSDSALIERLPRLLERVCNIYKPDIVVVACNTASTIALEEVRLALKVPVVGTVPAIKPASGLSKSKVIGLLGTPGTVRRRYTDRLIEEFAGDCHVIRHGSAALVDLAEQELRGDGANVEEVKRAISELFAQDRGEQIDTVVLACTHFPLLKDKLRRSSDRPVQWIDSGRAIARRVISLLGEQDVKGHYMPEARAVFTSPQKDLSSALEQFGLTTIDFLEL